MDDYKDLLSELQVDWDYTLNSNFNPLKLALKVIGNSKTQKNFNETFFRLNSAIDRVIKSNFEVFGESFKSFEKLNLKNKEIIEKYEQINNILNNVPYLHDNINLASLNLNQDTEYKEAYEICSKIIEARNLYKEFKLARDDFRKSKLITESIEILKREEFSQIKGVFEFYKIVYKDYLEYSEQIHSNLLDFVIQNKNKNFQYFSIILVLKSNNEFNEYCDKYFYVKVLEHYEKTIFEASRVSDCTVESICKQISDLSEQILSNMWILVERFTNLNSSEDEDYFGKLRGRKGFIYEIQKSIDTIKQILFKFIDLYAYDIELESSFDISFISDRIDFSKIFDIDTPVYKRLEGSISKIPSYNKSAIPTGSSSQIAKALLSFIKTPELRIFLEEIIYNKKYSGAFLDMKIEEINNFFLFFSTTNEDIDKLESLIINSLICIGPFDSISRFKEFLNRKLFVEFLKICDEIFSSELIKKPYFKTVLDNIQDEELSITIEKMTYSLDDLKKSLISQTINKKTLFIHSNKYEIIKKIIKILTVIETEIKSEKLEMVKDLFVCCLKRQCIVDFFYFYDLLYRQGNYQFYLKLCSEVIEKIREFEVFEDLENCFDFYNKMNVHSIKCKTNLEMKEYLDFLKIFCEIVGLEFNIIKTIEFYEKVLKNESKDKQGKILEKKIN